MIVVVCCESAAYTDIIVADKSNDARKKLHINVNVVYSLSVSSTIRLNFKLDPFKDEPFLEKQSYFITAL